MQPVARIADALKSMDARDQGRHVTWHDDQTRSHLTSWFPLKPPWVPDNQPARVDLHPSAIPPTCPTAQELLSRLIKQRTTFTTLWHHSRWLKKLKNRKQLPKFLRSQPRWTRALPMGSPRMLCKQKLCRKTLSCLMRQPTSLL